MSESNVNIAADSSQTNPLMTHLHKDELLFVTGEHTSDLFLVHSGKLLVFVVNGTQITSIAQINASEYVGELSFFDKRPRSACVIAMDETELIKIPINEIDKQFPSWLIMIAKSITTKIRKADEIIRLNGIRKQNVKSLKPLAIDEQRRLFDLVKKYIDKNQLQMDIMTRGMFDI